MKNKYSVALLLAPVLFLALLFVVTDESLQASPHRDRDYRDGSYARSVAVVWALDSIKDDVSCHDSLNKYQRDFRGLEGGDAREEIAATYEDLVGACNDHGPHAAARQQAAFYLEGMQVER